MWIIALVAAVLVGAALGLSLVQTPTYESSIRMLVGQERGTSETPREDVMGLQQLTQTMAEAVKSRSVAKAVIQQQDLQVTPEDFLENLRVGQIPRTQFIEVFYKDSSPERAQQVTTAIGDVFTEQVSQTSPSASAITVTVWEPAERPDEPVSPRPVRNAILALVIGLVLGTGLAFLLEYLDDSWRSPEEAEQITGVPTFGLIPQIEVLTGEKKGRG